MSVMVIEVDEVGVVEEISAEEAVQNGMKLLDERFGTNFHEKINLETLNIGSGISCVCGQLYGGYIEGRNTLGLTDDEATTYGFFGRTGFYDRLNRAWKDALLARSA